jgi:hypothetical protein
MKCGEKWTRQHKCPDKISLHVLEEVLDVLKSDECKDNSKEDSSDDDDDEDDEQVF